MKLQTIVFIGVGLFIVYKLGRRFNADRSQPKLIKNTDAAVLSGGIPGADAVEGLYVSPPPALSPNAEEVFAMVQQPVNRSIFPENVFKKFSVNESGESVKTYETA